MTLEINANARGFMHAEFQDHYGVKCSVQDSSLVWPPALWLGADHHLSDKHMDNYRMHLTQEMVAELLPLLTRFVEKGSIAP